MKQRNDNNYNRSSGAFSSILTLIFITLKLLEKITWGWIWVLSPIWIDFGLCVVIGILIAVINGVKK